MLRGVHRPSAAGHRRAAARATLPFMLFLILAAPTVAIAATYVVVDLGATPPGISAVVRGLNDSGEAVGGSITFGAGQRGFVVTRTSLEMIEGLAGSDYTIAFGINYLSQIVGSSNTATTVRAFRWTRQQGAEDLGTLAGDSGAAAFAINGHGQVVGYSSGPQGTRAVLWGVGGGITNLGTLPGGRTSRALAISDSGRVAGVSGMRSGDRGFRWTTAAGLQDLGQYQQRGRCRRFVDGLRWPPGRRVVRPRDD